MPRSAKAASANPACLIRTDPLPEAGENLPFPQGAPGTNTPLPHYEYVKVHVGTWGMSPGELAASYRLYAAYCAEIAQTVTDSARKVALLDMAQAWARLAELADKNPPPEEASAAAP
jgi:hypothetical protein